MKPNELLAKRFQELDDKADALLKKKEFKFQGQSGTNYFTISSADFKGWATSVLSLLQRVFGESSIHYQNLHDHYKSFDGYSSKLEECRAILQAAREDYEGGYLLDYRGIVQAEVFDQVLEQAGELLRAGYKDAACVVVGVALETTLKELCTKKGLAHGKLDRMNADHCKAGTYNMGMQKQITAWAERRNKAAHGEWGTYTQADVEDFIRGVNRLIGDFL
jgi:hypothetical protein